ncbi:MAG: DUF4124 domain-containing protein [Desulfobacterales bacterium]|jgi:hypothetical protein
MYRLKIIIPLFFLVFTGAASAEFYKYVDEKGNVHFTDDFNQVPVSQRQQVHGYEEYRPPEPAAASQAKIDPAGEPGTDETAPSETRDDGEALDFDNQLKALDQRKAELSGEYEALMKENAHLNEMKKTVKNKAAADQYNESVRKLNAKLQEHDRKRKEFFSDVENYNARVGQENKARQKSKSTTP